AGEERLPLVLGVVRRGEGPGDLRQPCATKGEPPALEAGDDLAAKPAADRVRLAEDEGALDRHERGSLLSAALGAAGGLQGLERGRRRDGGLAVGADLPERLERRLAADARLL